MNNDSKAMGAEARDLLAGAHGSLALDSTGALRTRVVANAGAARAAEAGDGFAAELVDAVTTGDVTTLTVNRGWLSAVRAAGVADLGHKRGTPAGGRAEAAQTEPRAATYGSRERALPVDMTNWSVIVDGATVVKVVGTWGGADRAARQLTRIGDSGVAIIPGFVGSLDWHHPERGTSTIALVSEFLDGAEDGWTWAVEDVLAYIAGGPEPEWPARIGELAAELHKALAPFTDDEAPRPTGEALRARAEAALGEALRVTGGDAGVRLRNRATAIRATLAAIPDQPIGPVFDLHGDLHVGQILRASVPGTHPGQHRYWVIDFDGDPQLADAERDQPDYAARDIAHLLSSVDLVGAVAMKRLGGASQAVLDWAGGARDQSLSAYRASLATGSLDHPSFVFDERLIAGFLSEQLLRELIYADRFLPRWQYAPDAAIFFRYPPTPGHGADTTQEQQWTPPDFTTI
jgi:maltokinase